MKTGYHGSCVVFLRKYGFLGIDYILPDYACDDPEMAVAWLCWTLKAYKDPEAARIAARWVVENLKEGKQ